MADVGRHPNIRVLANTDVVAVEGQAGDFTVTVVRRPRYVDEDLCTACRACATYCPYSLPNPFDENLSQAKAIDVWSPQAIPSAAVVDREACLFFQEEKCKICVPVCRANAIDFTQKRKRATFRVGAVVVSPGYEIFDATAATQYGYGRMKNVVNSLEFERILDADGPHKGLILRPSDGQIPSKIAWLQCVGSRDLKLGHSYCSSVCCTYAIKQAVLVRDHFPDTQVAIFHNDIRTPGKGYEALYLRAQAMEGVRFIRRRISAIRENGHDGNLIVRYAADDHAMEEEEFGMVVLSVGMVPSKGNESQARMMSFGLDEHGFCETGCFSPNEIEGRPGIFPAATFTGPMDIPDSIASAAGAGSLAAQLLHGQRDSLTQERTYPDERPVEAEGARIGVFVCHCGSNIAAVADTTALAEYALTLDDVVHCEEQVVSCTADSFDQIIEAIREKGLNRVVVAACSPRHHEAPFREALRDAGLNPYLLEMANIREHCTWVHSREKEEATQKAKDLIAMSVARARNLVALTDTPLPVHKKGLIIGGGLAGMTAALALARQGFGVCLVEKEDELGGNLRSLRYTLEGEDVQQFLTRLRDEVEAEEKIEVFKSHELKAVSGVVGGFTSTLARVNSDDSGTVDVQHGIIIVASGGGTARPAEYRYGESAKVVTQPELEDMAASGTLPKDLKQVVMIQCVGSRNEERPYCSRICCGEAIKNALKLKELDEELNIVVFYRDIRACGFREDYYREARERGVLFIQYDPARSPEVGIRGDDVLVSYYDSILEMEGEIDADLLVLSTPIIPEGNQELSRLLRVPLTEDGFFMEAHLKLRPLDFSMDGVFLCGMAHYPKHIPETISQANGAALRAATILSRDTVETSGAVSEIDEDACTACGLCVRVCPYGAIGMQDAEEGTTARIVSAMCKGCGVCSSVCPADAIWAKHSTDEQISSQIDAAYSVPMVRPQAKILAFLCNWCGYPGADLAGTSRIQHASNTRVIKVMCSGRIHPKHVYQAFHQGMDAVLVVGCHLPDCHYVSGVEQTIKMVATTKKVLERSGISPERLRLEHVSAAEGVKYARMVDSFSAAMSELGPLELDAEQRTELQRLKDRKARVKGKMGKAESAVPADDR